jgi:hypothetical protein
MIGCDLEYILQFDKIACVLLYLILSLYLTCLVSEVSVIEIPPGITVCESYRLVHVNSDLLIISVNLHF